MAAILSSLEGLNADLIIKSLAVLIVAWKAYEEVKRMVKAVNDRHDKEKKWDQYEQNLKEERDKIYKKYDTTLTELENKIDENHCDTEAKIQELRAEMLMMTKCMSAVLDGLKQLNCNGSVTEMKKNLDEFLMQKAYDL